MEYLLINQNIAYCKDLIHRFGMENAKHMAAPMSTACYLDKDKTGQSIDIKKYRGMIGSLLYLSTSIPDIMFSVCIHTEINLCYQLFNKLNSKEQTFYSSGLKLGFNFSSLFLVQFSLR